MSGIGSVEGVEQDDIDELQLGSVRCDFMSLATFLRVCKAWLDSASFHHVVTLNPEMVLLAERDQQFAEAVGAADLRVPDGAGLIWAQWFIRSEFWSLWPSLIALAFRKVERVQGVDVVEHLAEMCADRSKSIYLLGGTASEVDKTAKRLTKKYPALTLHTSRDHALDMNGPSDVISDIQEKKPDVLFVAYGAPAQSVWIDRHQTELPSVKIAIGVGGAFSILSEEKPRAPRWMRTLNIEWLWRLALEPSRLPRIWRATIKFPLYIQRQKDSSRS